MSCLSVLSIHAALFCRKWHFSSFSRCASTQSLSPNTFSLYFSHLSPFFISFFSFYLLPPFPREICSLALCSPPPISSHAWPPTFVSSASPPLPSFPLHSTSRLLANAATLQHNWSMAKLRQAWGFHTVEVSAEKKNTHNNVETQ